MGKQINFYMENELQEIFLHHVFNQKFIIIAEDFNKNELVIYKEFCEINPAVSFLYLYKKEYGQLIIDKKFSNRLDSYRSPVIEFMRNGIIDEKKIVTRGRLWMESKYYDSNDELITKDIKLIKDYNSLVRYVKKLIPFQEVQKGDYIIKEYITDNIKDLTNKGFKLM